MKRVVVALDDPTDADDFRVTYAGQSQQRMSSSDDEDDAPKFERRQGKVLLKFSDTEIEKEKRRQREWADEHVAELKPAGDVIRVFTDGSARQNGSVKAKGGIGVYFPDHQAPSVSLPYHGNHLVIANGALVREEFGTGVATNQRAELEAIRVAIELAAATKGYERKKTEIHIFTDSEYAINCLTVWIYTWVANDWKTSRRKDVLNKDIIEPLFSLVIENRVLFFHTLAHTDKQDERSRGNAVANSLAQDGSAPPRKKARKIKARN